jgi:hypothetical protein
VWARKSVGVFECPRSLITAQSLGWIEEYGARKQLGGVRVEELSAREAEAFLILEQLLSREDANG